MKLTDRTKGILAGVLCFMLVIVGTAAFGCFFFSAAGTVDLAFNGADMTTWETDPYIREAETGIMAVYLCGLYFLLSLPLIRLKRKSMNPGIAAAAVIAVPSFALCLSWGWPCIFIILFSLPALLSVRRKYKPYCIGIAAVCVSAAVSIAVSYLVIYIQLPLSQELYDYCCFSYPTRDFAQFMEYAIQPLIICAVCCILFHIARRKEKSTENHPDEEESVSMNYRLCRWFLFVAMMILLPAALTCAGAEEARDICRYRIENADGLYGYINREGEVVIEPQYTYASEFDEYGYAIVEDSNRFVLLDADGTEIARAPEIRHNKISYLLTGFGEEQREGLFSPTTGTLIWYDGYILDGPADDPESTRVLVSPDDVHYGYLDRTTGEMAIPVQYDSVCYDWTQMSDRDGYQFVCYDFSCFHEGYAIVGNCTDESDYRHWLIDENGNEIALPGMPVTGVYEDRLNIWKDQKWYVCTTDGRILSDGYDEIRSYHDGYCAAINWYPPEEYEEDDERRDHYPEFVILDADGQAVYRHDKYYGHEKSDIRVHNGYMRITENFCAFTEFHSIQEGLLCTIPAEPVAVDYERGLMLITDEVSELLCRLDGTVLYRLPYGACKETATEEDPISNDYTWIQYFFEEGRWVFCGDNAEGKRRYGYLDEDYSWAIQPQYIRAVNFRNGLALCVDEQGYSVYIDTQGKTVWKSDSPLNVEKDRERLDLAGFWYRQEEDKVCWLMIDPDPDVNACCYTEVRNGVWEDIQGLTIEKVSSLFADEAVTPAATGNSWTHLNESMKEIRSVWHRKNITETDKYIRLFTDGTYEVAEGLDDRPDNEAIMTDYGRLEGNVMISEMPGAAKETYPTLTEEDGLLTYFYQAEAFCTKLSEDFGYGIGWDYTPYDCAFFADILPPELHADSFLLKEDGIWEYSNDFEGLTHWYREGDTLTLVNLIGTEYQLTVDDESGRLYYKGTCRKTYNRFPGKTPEDIDFCQVEMNNGISGLISEQPDHDTWENMKKGWLCGVRIGMTRAETPAEYQGKDIIVDDWDRPLSDGIQVNQSYDGYGVDCIVCDDFDIDGMKPGMTVEELIARLGEPGEKTEDRLFFRGEPFVGGTDFEPFFIFNEDGIICGAGIQYGNWY